MSELQLDGLVFNNLHQQLQDLGATDNCPIEGAVLSMYDMPIDVVLGCTIEPPTITMAEMLPANDAGMTARLKRYELVDGCVNAYSGTSDNQVGIMLPADIRLPAITKGVQLRRVQSGLALGDLANTLDVFQPYAD